ncbi:MAG: hypothetical protein P4L84_06840, partial [Isosphaeraceae bacterium]|nr:hypothetical protein [Isosphaeraceae bacterium]
GVAATPEESTHTSLRTRLDQCRGEGTLETLRDDLSTVTRDAAQELGGWLLPIEDRRAEGNLRGGVMPGLTLSCYLRLVDWTSRLLRAGKTHVPAVVCSISERLQADAIEWGATVSAMFAGSRRTGCHFGRAERLAAAAAAHGRRWHRNQVPRDRSASVPAA